MKALITGASSGIGRDMARVLSECGIDLVLVARRKNRLEKLKKELKTNVQIITLDLSSSLNAMELYNNLKDENIDILINNAGFGLYGEFYETPIEKELDMIDLNIKAVHTLTKLFLDDFIKRNSGYILNVSSLAAFQAGPKMATYYATKAYVLHLTEAIYEELRHKKSSVYIGALCPGPVDTEFNKIAHVKFALNGLNSYDVAKYTVKKMFQKKNIIIPGTFMKVAIFFERLVPRKLLLKITYNIQERKNAK